MSHYELETKLELDRQGFEKLRSHGKVCKHIDQLNVYYDNGNQLSQAAATFRIRVAARKRAVMTLKVPAGQREGARRCLEIEEPLQPSCKKVLKKEVKVGDEDIPVDFSKALCELGVHHLQRIGWMRTQRWVVQIGQLLFELDEVHLPSGETFFEAEFESDSEETHQAASALIRALAASARPSTVSKYERFVESLRCVTERRQRTSEQESRFMPVKNDRNCFAHSHGAYGSVEAACDYYYAARE